MNVLMLIDDAKDMCQNRSRCNKITINRTNRRLQTKDPRACYWESVISVTFNVLCLHAEHNTWFGCVGSDSHKHV